MTRPAFFTGMFSRHHSPALPADLLRGWVIAALVLSIAGITYIAMAAGYGTVIPQLFYFPILYAAWFYPGRSLYVASGCAAVFLIVAVPLVPPHALAIGGIVFQAVLFVLIAAGAGFVLKAREGAPFAEPADESGSILAMIRTGECDFVEFKREALWSLGLTKEEITANESLEVRKYGHHASKFIIARSIAGFLNAEGGDLVIGVREDRVLNTLEVTGIGNDYARLAEKDRNTDGYRRMLIDAIVRKYLPEVYESAAKYLRISFPVVQGKTVCHVHVAPSEKPVLVDTGSEEIFFIRIDASTRALTGKAMARYVLNRFAPR